MFVAINENYELTSQYRYTWITIQKPARSSCNYIWKNLQLFMDWMETSFEKNQIHRVIGKSYELSDNILYRVQRQEPKKNNGNANAAKQIATWLMTDVFRYVKNPDRTKITQQKYVGKVKFQKLVYRKKLNKFVKWNPSKRNDDGSVVEPDDIQIVVYEDDEMKIERRYELEYGWEDKWKTEKIYELKEEPVNNPQKLKQYKEYHNFIERWTKLEVNLEVPIWYCFDPRKPNKEHEDHNRLRPWFPDLFDFLKDEKWNYVLNDNDDINKNNLEEKSEFVIDCKNLLGIGGEGIVIRKSIAKEEKALKIIPLKKYHILNETPCNETK